MILRISISTLRSASERISSSVLTLPSDVVARGFVVDDGRLGNCVGFLRIWRPKPPCLSAKAFTCSGVRKPSSGSSSLIFFVSVPVEGGLGGDSRGGDGERATFFFFGLETGRMRLQKKIYKDVFKLILRIFVA